MKAKPWLRLRTVLLTVVAAGVLAGAAAADTIPWIPGDGQDEDMPAAAGAAQPILHVHVFSHWVGFVQSLAPQAGYIDCPSACARPVAPGTTMTLFAQKNQDDTGALGLRFSHWTGDICEGVTTPTCTFTMPSGDDSVDVVAVFEGLYAAPVPVVVHHNNPPGQSDGEQPGDEGPGCGRFCD